MSNANTLRRLESKLSDLSEREQVAISNAVESAARSATNRVKAAYAGRRALLTAQIDAVRALVAAEEEARSASGRAKPGPKPRIIEEDVA